MSPKIMYDLIQRLTPQQKHAVNEIGFGSLLHLDININEATLILYFIENFDVYRCSLKLEEDELLIEDEDVQCTLGLPRGQKQVQEGTKNEINGEEAYEKIVKEWKQRWNIDKRSPLLTTMAEEIPKRGDSKDMFKRDFVVFTVSSMLHGNQTRHSNYRILQSLINVSDIKNYNWCSYTYKSMIESIERYGKKPGTFFTGPVAFMMLVYLDRIQFKGMHFDRKYPTITGWSANLVKQRLKAKKKTGNFGKGKVIPRMSQPGSSRLNLPNSSVEKVAQVVQKLASTVIEFGEATAEVGREGAPVEVMKKTFSGISNMLNVVTTMESPSTPTSSQQDDIFFRQENFVTVVDALVEAFNKTTKQIHPDAPTFDLGLTLTPPSQPPQAQQTPSERTVPITTLTASVDDVNNR